MIKKSKVTIIRTIIKMMQIVIKTTNQQPMITMNLLVMLMKIYVGTSLQKQKMIHCILA